MFNLRNLGKKISALPEFFGFDKMPGGRIASSEAAVNNARLATSGADFLSSYLSYRYYDAGRRIFFNDLIIINDTLDSFLDEEIKF